MSGDDAAAQTTPCSTPAGDQLQAGSGRASATEAPAPSHHDWERPGPELVDEVMPTQCLDEVAAEVAAALHHHRGTVPTLSLATGPSATPPSSNVDLFQSTFPSVREAMSCPPLVDDVRSSAERLEATWAGMTPEGMGRSRTARDRPWPCRELLYHRWREVEVHHSDWGLAYDVRDWLTNTWLASCRAPWRRSPTALRDPEERRRLLAWLLTCRRAPDVSGWRAGRRTTGTTSPTPTRAQGLADRGVGDTDRVADVSRRGRSSGRGSPRRHASLRVTATIRRRQRWSPDRQARGAR